MPNKRPQILVAEHEHELPYSKGLTASALMMTGLGPGRAYSVANKVEQALIATGKTAVTEGELDDLTVEVIREEAGDQFAETFIKWRSVRELDIPLIILLGGTTGVGKSTIATQLAVRLGITRVVSTDAVREVLRAAFTEEMFPTLYASSFEADKAVRQPIPHSGDRLIIGFREQAAAVAVGTKSLIDRALAEGTDMILEGAHLVPGFLEGIESERAVIVPLLITVEDEDLHRSHFHWRSREARPKDRYLSNFKKIRRIQKYMSTSALVRGVPVVAHIDLDTTLMEVIDHIFVKVLEAVESGLSEPRTDEGLLGRAVEVASTQRNEGSTEREAVP